MRHLYKTDCSTPKNRYLFEFALYFEHIRRFTLLYVSPTFPQTYNVNIPSYEYSCENKAYT